MTIFKKGNTHDRAFYYVPEDLARQIQEKAVRTVSDQELDNNNFTPTIALDPGFMAVLIQGYFSSPFVDKELKDQMLDLYMSLLTFSYDDEDEMDRAYEHGKKLITDGDRIRFLLTKAKEAKERINGHYDCGTGEPTVIKPNEQEILDVGSGDAC